MEIFEIPIELKDAIIALISAIIGWLTNKLTTKKQKNESVQ